MRLWFLLLLAAAGTDTAAIACNVPVFRYALERWRSDAYQLVVLHKGPLAEADQPRIDAFRQESYSESGHCNFELILADVDDKQSEPYRQLLAQGQPKEAALPRVFLLPPAERDTPSPLWSGSLADANPARLLDSPARREIVKRLAGGDSAVWVLVSSGDRKRDAQAAKLVDEKIKVLEQELQLPPGIGQPGSEVYSEIPLKIKFSALQIRRDDPEERVLLDMLLAGQPSLATEKGPLAFAIFGRARVLGGIGGDDLNEDLLMEASAMLCGPCSCQMKEMNPGYDLLARADWDSLITGELSGPQAMPPLKGFSEFVAASATATPPAKNEPPAPPVKKMSVRQTADRGALIRSVGGIVVATLVVLGAASILVVRRRK